MGHGRWLQNLEEMLQEPKRTPKGEADRQATSSEKPLACARAAFRRRSRLTALAAADGRVSGHRVLACRGFWSSSCSVQRSCRRLVPTHRAAVGSSRRGNSRKTTRSLSRFLFMQLVVNANLWTGARRRTSSFPSRMPYPALVGNPGCHLAVSVPYVGTWLASRPESCCSVMAVAPTWTLPLLVLAFVVVLELSDSPMSSSRGFSGTTLESWQSRHDRSDEIFWAWLWGPIGLIT